jgi:ATP/maltotriose-dependent transcriptional regulator MalT
MNESELMPDQLLATKFFIPGAAQALIARPRLTALLDTSLRRKLTLVAAPAGFGKTTLVADWLHNFGLPMLDFGLDARDEGTIANPKSGALGRIQNFRVAWLSLDEADNDSVWTRFQVDTEERYEWRPRCRSTATIGSR